MKIAGETGQERRAEGCGGQSRPRKVAASADKSGHRAKFGFPDSTQAKLAVDTRVRPRGRQDASNADSRRTPPGTVALCYPTAGCGRPHVRRCGRVTGRNPRDPVRSGSGGFARASGATLANRVNGRGAKPLPQGKPAGSEGRGSPVGASLLAIPAGKRFAQTSRRKAAPKGQTGALGGSRFACRSELARDSGGQTIASELAPTGFGEVPAYRVS